MKAHKKYEYGCKGSIVITQKVRVVVEAITFKPNVYDGHTLEEVLTQTKELTSKSHLKAWVNGGY